MAEAETAQRPARVVMSPSLWGIDPAYAERELERDMALHGGFNETVDPRSGKSPANAFRNIVVARPNSEYTALGPQFVGTKCLHHYPLDVCPFPGLCPPPADESSPQSTKPCAEWGEGRPASLKRFLDAGDTRANETFRNEPLSWDIPGRWKGDLWHPCTCIFSVCLSSS